MAVQFCDHFGSIFVSILAPFLCPFGVHFWVNFWVHSPSAEFQSGICCQETKPHSESQERLVPAWERRIHGKLPASPFTNSQEHRTHRVGRDPKAHPIPMGTFHHPGLLQGWNPIPGMEFPTCAGRRDGREVLCWMHIPTALWS